MNVSLLIEIPKELHEELQEFMTSQPEWSQDRTFTSAVALFLLQKRSSGNLRIGRIYLESLFDLPIQGSA